MTTERETTERIHVGGGSTRFAAVRERFGGVDTPAAIGGMLTAVGVFLVLAGLAAAGANTIDFQVDQLDAEGTLEEFSALGVLAATIALFVAFFVGGWATGRMARYDGGINGIMTAVWMLLFVVGFAALGTWVGEEYNAFAGMNLPDWVSVWNTEDVTGLAIAGGLAGIAAMFLGGWIGGRVGVLWHRRVDAALASASAEASRIPVAVAHQVGDIDDRAERTIGEEHDLETRLSSDSTLPPHPPM